MNVAEIISSLESAPQSPFLSHLSNNNISIPEDVRKAKKRFINNTICTIGYEGPDQKTLSERLEHHQSKPGDRIKTDIDTIHQTGAPRTKRLVFTPRSEESRANCLPLKKNMGS